VADPSRSWFRRLGLLGRYLAAFQELWKSLETLSRRWCERRRGKRSGERSWSDYFEQAHRFTDDYPERIDDAPPQEREKF
jgi:hypothetical protein